MTGLLRFHTAGVGVDLVGVVGDLADILRSVGAGMLPHGMHGSSRVDCQLVVRNDADGRRWFQGRELDPDPTVAAATLISAVDRAALSSTPCLAVHAAAVAGDGGAAMIPGVSGSGKSTLAGACMQSGLLLVSDEAACIAPATLRLLPHPRPLGLGAHSRALLGLSAFGESADELATAPGLLGGCVPSTTEVEVALVVVAERRSGAPPALTPGSRAEGLSALLGHCLNTGSGLAWSPEAAWRLLARLAAEICVARLTYDRPEDGAALLGQSLASRRSPRTLAGPD